MDDQSVIRLPVASTLASMMKRSSVRREDLKLSTERLSLMMTESRVRLETYGSVLITGDGRVLAGPGIHTARRATGGNRRVSLHYRTMKVSEADWPILLWVMTREEKSVCAWRVPGYSGDGVLTVDIRIAPGARS